MLKYPWSILFVVVLILAACTDKQVVDKESQGKGVPKFYKSENMFSVVDEIGFGKYRPKVKYKNLKTQSEFLSAAKDALSQNAYLEAADYAKSAIKLDNNSGMAHHIRGKALSASAIGSDEEALAEMKLATQLGVENGDLYEYMAKIYDGKRDYPKAIDALNKAIKLAPGNRDNFRYRGALYDMLGEHQRAEADYTTNIAMAPDKVSSAYLDRGLMYEGNKRYKEALSDYTKALNLETRDTDELRARVRVLVIMGREDEALKDLSEIIERNPTDDDSIRLRGDIFSKRKMYKEAIEDYSSVISNSPDQAKHSYENRAKVYEIIGESQKALMDKEKAKEIESRPAEKPLYELKRM